MSTPLFGLFNVSILLVWLIERGRRASAWRRWPRRPAPTWSRRATRSGPRAKNLTRRRGREDGQGDPCWANFLTVGRAFCRRGSCSSRPVRGGEPWRVCSDGCGRATTIPASGQIVFRVGEPDPCAEVRHVPSPQAGVTLVGLAAFAWFGVTVKLGSMTLFQHLRAIGQTKESQELVDGTRAGRRSAGRRRSPQVPEGDQDEQERRTRGGKGRQQAADRGQARAGDGPPEESVVSAPIARPPPPHKTVDR